MKTNTFPFLVYGFAALLTVLVFILCITVGSVQIPLSEIFAILFRRVEEGSVFRTILIQVRIPRVLSAAFVGAALSLAGAAMQGLLKNPLADGSTLGVSSGAALGAVFAIYFNVSILGSMRIGLMFFAVCFAFLSFLLILAIARKIDFTLSGSTVILTGVIFSMFASSITSLLTVMDNDKVRSIIFWSMGSFSGSGSLDALLTGVALAVGGIPILLLANELNAFALGEEKAYSLGVNVPKTKYLLFGATAVLVGVSVSVSGTIGFIGLVVPHISRLITGPNHRRLLPFTLFGGAIFTMLTDLLSRTILSPIELPIGVATSFIGSLLFIYIFYSRRNGNT